MSALIHALTDHILAGYAERMRKSFGEIYLGMDEPEHAPKSKLPNQAIMNISRREAFDLSFAVTERVLAALLDGRADPTVEVKDIVDGVLAGLCTTWFGIPDEDKHVIAGGWHWMPDEPPTCPGHFSAPSRYMFQPNPGAEAEKTGKAHGEALAKAVGKFVAKHRPPHTPGSAPPSHTVPTASLAKDIFNAIPYREKEDPGNLELTSTLIGAMMGFLPTVDGNLRGALYEWINDRSLWDHQIAYLAAQGRKRKRPLDEAASAYPLKVPLRRTLQLRPVPELAWRTARESAKLGKVDLSPGDIIVASIVSATQQALTEDDPDLDLLFGGKRTAADQKNHACPGRQMAMGVILGFLAALMQTVRMRPTLSPMALQISPRNVGAAPAPAPAPATSAIPSPAH